MKEAYYFSHDANAMLDPKILAMRCDYGMEGYGVYWAIIELLRNEQDYKLPLTKTTFKSLKMLCNNTSFDIEQFINDCIEYELFKKDDIYFWSNSLVNRMLKMDNAKQKRINAAKSRWNANTDDKNDSSNVDAMHEQSISNADAKDLQCNAKEKKVNEKKIKENKLNQSKGNESNNIPQKSNLPPESSKKESLKINYAEYVTMTNAEYEKLVSTYGELDAKKMIDILDNYKGSSGKKYKSDYRAILNWVVDKLTEEKHKKLQKPKPIGTSKASNQTQNIQNGIELYEKYKKLEEEGGEAIDIW